MNCATSRLRLAAAWLLAGALAAAAGASGYLAKAAATASSILGRMLSALVSLTLPTATPSHTSCLRAASTTSMLSVPSV